MATNDTIDLLYGKNANFLDAGGKATPETIKEAFRLVLKNQNVITLKSHILIQVKVILVNIFGGEIASYNPNDRCHPGRYDSKRYPLRNGSSPHPRPRRRANSRHKWKTRNAYGYPSL